MEAGIRLRLDMDKKEKRGRRKVKALASPPVNRMIEEPPVSKDEPQYIFNVRFGWLKKNSLGKSMAETAAKSANERTD